MTARAAVIVAALLGCGRGEPTHAPTPTPAGPRAGGDDAAPAGPVIPAASRQLLTAIPADWDATTASLRLWRRDAGGPWQAVGAPWAAVIGKTGAAWGRGLHGDGAPPTLDGPAKVEGDGKSPAGAFALRGSYGYAATAVAGARLPYTALDDGWQCVDDPASTHYATILDRRTTTPDWRSAETMRRPDALYTWVVDVAHNPRRQPGAGSCIFLHVWRGPDSVTVGCTAMAEPDLAHLLVALDPEATPTFVLLPGAAYDAVAPAWGLPPR
jgi:hypothetical protein